MRLLVFNIEQKLIDMIEENKLYITDIAEDIDDAIYHSKVRYYNLILIRSDDFFACKELLQDLNCRFTAVIIISNNPSKKFQIQLLKAGAIDVIKEPICTNTILSRMESIHRENFQNEIFYKQKYKAIIEDENIVDIANNKAQLKGKTFSILVYMLKNRHRGAISKEELLHTNWHEPEMVSDNVIEVNINLIRNALKSAFNENFIETIRHKGYKISN